METYSLSLLYYTYRL